jgi:OmpR family response regulator RpaB
VKVLTKKILIVDKEFHIRHLVANHLVPLGYTVLLASNGKDAFDSFIKEKPGLIIVDTILPQLDGYALCRKIRDKSEAPIIMLSALGNVSARVMGLALGADDYITKPFSLKELEVRIEAILRRVNSPPSKVSTKHQKIYQIGSLLLDMNTQIVKKGNLKVQLTNTEYQVLELLIGNAGKNLSRAIIFNNVWGYTPERHIDTRLVDVYITRIRSKIEEDPSNPDLIITVRGTGYMFFKH